MKRRAADVLTGARMVFSVILLFIPVFSTAFYVLWALCGVTDLLDGPVARATGSAGTAGARLDSAADTLFALALAVRLLPVLPWKGWMLLWIGCIAAARGVSAVVSWRRFGVPAFLHTRANKVSGFALFCSPALIGLLGLPVSAGILCALTTFSSLEELALLATLPSLDRDVRGWWRRSAKF